MAPFSIGTDIEEVSRIKKLVRSQRFLNRVFNEEEIHYCKSKKNSAQHFAVRFAAKEAVWKALSQHFNGKGVGHREISVQRTLSGKPQVMLSARLKKFERHLSLSLSHTKTCALAVAIYIPQ